MSLTDDSTGPAPLDFVRNAPSDPHAPHVRTASVRVDAGADAGPLARLWESIGYDEINWTYTATGRGLLKRFGELTDTGYHVRPHYVFNSGGGFGLPHLGSGNVYHEHADGTPYYDFSIVDRVYDAIVEAGHHVLVELAFTPRDLLPPEADEFTVPSSPTVYSAYEHGQWGYPPRDYGRWGDLVAALVEHCVERYGADEVDAWLWELWNEPDIFYWRGTHEQFCELYRATADAVRRVRPTARVGGPTVTGGGRDFLRGFLAFTAANDVPLDFVSFHTKGSGFSPWRVYGPLGGPPPEKQSPSSHLMLWEIRELNRIVAEFEQYRELPAIVDECDAGVPAHFGVYDNGNYRFQNTEYYPVFQVKLMKKILDLNERETVQVHEATSWSFYFEAERMFEGTRAFLTAHDVEKPLLNAYRMLGRLGDRRLTAVSDAEHSVDLLDSSDGGNMPEEVDCLAAAAADGTVTVLVWRHTDDQWQEDAEPTEVSVEVTGLRAGEYRIRHHRIDAAHSNAHSVWEGLGSPELPTEEQLRRIHEREGLEELEPEASATVADDGVFHATVLLPLPSVSLLTLEPVQSIG